MWRRMISSNGEVVTLRRPGTPNVDAEGIRAKIPSSFGAAARGLVSGSAGNVEAVRRSVILLAEDVDATVFGAGIKPKSDLIMWEGKSRIVLGVGERRVAGVKVAYDLQVSGD